MGGDVKDIDGDVVFLAGDDVLLPFLCQGGGNELKAGGVNRTVFWVLAELSRQRNARVVNALEAYLVLGWPREDACHQYGISVSYFSQRLKMMNQTWRLAQVLGRRLVESTQGHHEQRGEPEADE
ncbi:hypothetical protein ID80_004636 [Salmonella enterica subsp. enterica serovar Ball]|nr:hypothetical protein [Salmonella enterica subsp. enterica serovar Ball]